MSSRREGPPVAAGARRASALVEATPSQMIAAASNIGRRLSELALGSDKDVAWIGLIPANEREWRLSPLGLDLYDGLPGVALFLAQLGLISGERRYSELARSTINTVRRHLDESRSIEIIGGFSGLGGIIYALSHLGAMWADKSLFDDAETLLDVLPDFIARDKALDVIGGVAGLALFPGNVYAMP